MVQPSSSTSTKWMFGSFLIHALRPPAQSTNCHVCAPFEARRVPLGRTPDVPIYVVTLPTRVGFLFAYLLTAVICWLSVCFERGTRPANQGGALYATEPLLGSFSRFSRRRQVVWIGHQVTLCKSRLHATPTHFVKIAQPEAGLGVAGWTIVSYFDTRALEPVEEF